MENYHVYDFDFCGHTYSVRSDDKPEDVQAVFARMNKEAEEVRDPNQTLSRQDCLLVVALNLTKKLIDAENSNKIFDDLFNE